MSKKYNRREFLEKMGLTCACMGATTMLSGITNMGLLNAAAAANAPMYGQNEDYKALVCVLLNGGNDSYNMLVPRGASEYAQYADVRTTGKLEQADLLPINPLNPDGKLYGLHPSMGGVQNLFEAGNLAFIANIGTLVAPTTLTSYNAKVANPQGLFSHSDQAQHWQTSLPQLRNTTGWAGRMADIISTTNANQNISMSISLDGLNNFQKGNTTQGYAIASTGSGGVEINGISDTGFYESLKRQVLDDILENTYQNILRKAYSNTVSGSQENSLEFNAAIANGTTINTAFAGDGFSNKLQMVAKTIAARDLLGLRRQTFFVNLGGFDTHANSAARHANLMSTLNNGLSSFYNALTELGVENNVTTFSISDFGRKLTSNGDGTDHAWGGNAMVMGGAVNGQKIYGQYPELYLGNALDAGGGRLIPTTSCDEYFAELALWFGASTGDLDQILPNINNFWTPTAGNMPLGFMA